MHNSLRGAAAIVGAGVYGLGETPGQSSVEIMARAATETIRCRRRDIRFASL